MRIGVVLAVVVALGLAGCTSNEPSAPIIAPKGPGEQASTLSPEEASNQAVQPPNDADKTYVTMMIVHHQQALTMTKLVPDRSEDQTLRGLADRIEKSQEPEIGGMKQWQKQFGAEQSGHGGHNHSTMPGMATEAQLAELATLKGVDFYKRFLQLMIAHHEGAVKMATDLLGSGHNEFVEDMANDVIAVQTDEINRMKDMLAKA